MAALRAAAAAFLLLRLPIGRGSVFVGIFFALVAPLCWVTPQVGHFVQADPCLNLGKAPTGQTDGCRR
jgi:hypothetical protein